MVSLDHNEDDEFDESQQCEEIEGKTIDDSELDTISNVSEADEEDSETTEKVEVTPLPKDPPPLKSLTPKTAKPEIFDKNVQLLHENGKIDKVENPMPGKPKIVEKVEKMFKPSLSKADKSNTPKSTTKTPPDVKESPQNLQKVIETEVDDVLKEVITDQGESKQAKEVECDSASDIPLEPKKGHGKRTKFEFFSDTVKNGRMITTKELRRMKEVMKHSGETMESSGIWIDLASPEEQVCTEIGQIFGLHPLTVEDWFGGGCSEKIAYFEKYIGMTCVEMRYEEDSNVLRPFLFYVVFKKNMIVTIRFNKVLAIDEVKNRIRMKHQGDFPSAQWVLYVLFGMIMKEISVLSDQLLEDIETTSNLVPAMINDEKDEFLTRIEAIKKTARSLRFVVDPKKSMLRHMLRSKEKTITTNLKLYLRDVQDDTMKVLSRLDAMIDDITSIEDTYLAKITLSVNRYCKEENNLMHNFGVIGLLCLPMTFLAGLWGMNVRVPGQEVATIMWFVLLIGSSLLWLGAGIFFFKIVKFL
ncbi:magnesium and cobalt transport protein, putative [Entamoeba invadens IP1]|uniref:magnesium and cobalt transport protein, putative n=1 Tax=Entamoeba invadens IP1 TaxID=370355 RepID=UPI0002C3EEF0|nr:magnesium and cobalt transport protein, putative [Entamoeba invadens IP1]ELP93502.1 magnesium and cobalt transport protein, putative [Entamoeba invadens IP1]|eukprot:XP_004260273.1 magnesium and cobalt transport protein, putative [Entamoeba invadens IP1]